MPVEPRKIDLSPAVVDGEILAGEDLDRELRHIFWGSEVQRLPQPTYLMDGWIPKGSMTFLTGHGNSGKSLLALSWAQCIARGFAWAGHEVEDPGKVLYLTQEGVGAFPHRIQAWMQQRNTDEWTDNFGLLPATLQLGASAEAWGEDRYGPDWEFVLELIEEHNPVAVFIDPFADYFRPGGENSNDDVRLWASFARENILNRPNAPALIVPAHTSDANKRGGENRGATALYDAADRMYTITTHFPGEDKSGGFTSEGNPVAMKVSTLKSKDGSRPGVWYGEFVEHEVEDALNGTSVTIDGISPERYNMLAATSAASRATGLKESWATKVERELRDLGNATLDDLRPRLPGIKDSTLRSSLSRLVTDGTAERDDEGMYWIGDEPDAL